MFLKKYKYIKNFFSLSISSKYKSEFDISINKINVTRAKITSIIFIVLEFMQLMFLLIIKRGSLLQKNNIYYGTMYILFLVAMIVYLIIFIKLGKNISKHTAGIRITGVTFAGIILLWCACISLFDQWSSGQIIVYTVAIISIAVTPIFEPVTLFFIYLTVQVIFCIFLPYFQKSSAILYSNYINSTTFLIIAWGISCMMYKKQVDDFNNRKIIQEKSDELRVVNHKLEKLSQTDGLTGIFNRAMFDKTIGLEWDRCRLNFIPLSLIMIDLDFFKAFNDNYGHQAGDKCLKKVAAALLACVKHSSDTVARYGGEEFAVILPHVEKEDALVLAEQMRKMVEELAIIHEYSSVSHHVTISLGVYTDIPSNAFSIEDFIRTTDKALYEAKVVRNRTVVAYTDMFDNNM